jgi:hypothetical protein
VLVRWAMARAESSDVTAADEPPPPQG